MISFKIEKQEAEINNTTVKFDFPVYQTIFLNNFFYFLFDPNSDDKSYGQFFNLCAISTQGQILWKAELPTSQSDCFLNIYVKDNQLCAYSFSAYECNFDFKTGKIIKKTLIK